MYWVTHEYSAIYWAIHKYGGMYQAMYWATLQSLGT
jgi:hypothetical protein